MLSVSAQDRGKSQSYQMDVIRVEVCGVGLLRDKRTDPWNGRHDVEDPLRLHSIHELIVEEGAPRGP